MVKRVWLYALCGLSAVPFQAAAELQVGVGQRVITPDPLLPVSGGLGRPEPVREKRGDLTVRVLALQKADTRVAIVSLDLLGFPSVLGKRVAARVPRLSPESILFCATHTHSAPDCYAFPDEDGGHTGDLAYIDWVCSQAAAAINEAVDDLQPARIRIGTDKVAGKIAYNYYAPALYDPRMSVIQSVDVHGKVLATLVNFAIHPEVLGSGQGILSADLVRPLTDRIEERSGGMALFVNGAQGGMVTADNRNLDACSDPLHARWEDVRTWDECLRIGHAMADEALRIVNGVPLLKDPVLHCDSTLATFPVDSEPLWTVIQHSPLHYPRTGHRTIQTRINLISLGPAQILTIPGEALPNIGFYLKRKMRGSQSLLFGLTNDAFGYIMTEVDFNSFERYEYISRVSLGEKTGKILIDESLKLIERSSHSER